MAAGTRNAKKAGNEGMPQEARPARPRFARPNHLGLTPQEYAKLARLDTPHKIQAFLNAIPINHEVGGETVLSVREVLRQRRAHCIEGAMVAACALWVHGEPPLVMHLDCDLSDYPHVVALFRRAGAWGAISKTNGAPLRYRDPIYRTLRELALSYFHEYFMFGTGVKTLREYSRPVNLRRFGTRWVTATEDVWDIAFALAEAPHLPLVPEANIRQLRNAVPFECGALDRIEWDQADPRT